MHLRTHPNLLILIILLVVSSCNKKNNQTIIALNFDDSERILPDSIIDSIEVIPLEMNEVNYPYGIKNLFTSDDYIVIFDRRDVIFVYSSDGKYISDSKRRIGKGEGEYTNVTAVSFNKHDNLIEVVTPTKMLFYDLNFNIIGNSSLPTNMPSDDEDGLFFSSIYDLSSHEHLLIPTLGVENSRQIYLYDSSTGQINGKIDFSDGILANTSMQTQCFSPLSDETLLFFPPGISNYIYSFNPKTKEFNEYLHLNFGTNGLSDTELSRLSSDEEKLRDFVMNTEETVPQKF